MLTIHENYPLTKHNTFGINATARYFAAVSQTEGAVAFFRAGGHNHHPIMVLGEGSNTLFTGDYNGMVLHTSIMGKEVVEEKKGYVIVKIGSGENWDGFVEWCLENGFFGLENLSLIPGTVGASPVQNIGAYGVEVMDFIERVEGLFLDKCDEFSLSRESCRFTYRDSIFKQELKNKALITHVYFRLCKKPQLVINYGALDEEIKKFPVTSAQNIRKAVIDIRNRKLPDPKVNGNAGSFFKNPVVVATIFKQLRVKYPALPGWKNGPELIKLPAAWLIEQCGWKGKNLGKAATWHHQPLVLINLGGATGADILAIAQAIRDDVSEQFGIVLDFEVNIV